MALGRINGTSGISIEWSYCDRRFVNMASMKNAFWTSKGPFRLSLGATVGITAPPLLSVLRPMSHGFDAIAVSLNLMRALSGHDGLTAWYILSAVSLRALVVSLASKESRRVIACICVRRLLFCTCFGSFGRHKVCSASISCVGFGLTFLSLRVARVVHHALADGLCVASTWHW